MIAVATLSFCSVQATASAAIDSPTSSASGLSSWTRDSTSSRIQFLIMSAPPLSSVAREPSGGCSPGRYFPVSTPCAMGEYTTWEMPSSAQVGTTSASMTRHSMEYCGWLEIIEMPRSWARACPARSWSAVHSLTPM